LSNENEFPFLDQAKLEPDNSGWYTVNPISLVEECVSEKCQEPMYYALKVNTVNGYIKTDCQHLSGNCQLMTASGSV
jgi:hypothetical protein